VLVTTEMTGWIAVLPLLGVTVNQAALVTAVQLNVSAACKLTAAAGGTASAGSAISVRVSGCTANIDFGCAKMACNVSYGLTAGLGL
jgi:hypothetical protein